MSFKRVSFFTFIFAVLHLHVFVTFIHFDGRSYNTLTLPCERVIFHKFYLPVVTPVSGPSLCCISPAASDVSGLKQLGRMISIYITSMPSKIEHRPIVQILAFHINLMESMYFTSNVKLLERNGIFSETERGRIWVFSIDSIALVLTTTVWHTALKTMSSLSSVKLDDSVIQFSDTVKILGVTLDSTV